VGDATPKLTSQIINGKIFIVKGEL